MANFSALNRMIKLQILLNSKNVHLSHIACRNLTCSSVLALRYKQSQTTQEPPEQCQRTQQHWNSHASNRSTKYSSSKSFLKQTQNSTPLTSSQRTLCTKSAESIEDFRSREEKREAEYEQQQEKAKSQQENEARNAKAEAVRVKILEASLQHVPTLGWTRKAIVQGAEDAGYPSVVHGMFPDGGFDLVAYFNGKCNDEVLATMQKETENGAKEISNPLEFLVRFVRMRTEMTIPYKAQWPQAVALMALPKNAPTSLAQLLTLVDDICYYSGDRSVDIGWYTRRVGLAGIFKMTELYMLQDNSLDHSQTWEFLQNRMDDAIQLQSTFMKMGGVTNEVRKSFNSTFITARNMLGLNYNKS
ncbi:ubiquinone biosynthesis protein COQ9, mitochondrial [Stomoxys calcitrans]|uniref:ubiquinone biosynthesis protein COQ9, mitochondrial n=1 Tax=Stomoxys calcitrans TaxID=35570 RepID=UPI0027E2178D|nr:ubiquinone biosynthesis protein COQ9, mitochondrial [Stomoxys calcitrans]